MTNNYNTNIDSKRIILTVGVLMIFFLTLKLLSVWFFTSRGINLNFPYNSMLYDQFHRFTDFLIPIEWSKIQNPYDLSNDLYKSLPPSAYTILTFWMLRVADIVGPHIYFIILIAIGVWINYLIFSMIISENDTYVKIYIYFTFIMAFYPIWFLIDRGNTDVFTFIFISGVFYALLYKKNDIFIAIGIALIVSIKPSSGLFILPLIFIKKQYIILAFCIILFVYVLPIILFQNNIDYFMPVILKALESIGGQTTFVHNILGSVRVFGISTDGTINMLIPLLGVLILLFSIYKLYRSNSKFKREIALAQVIIISLLINDPDPDYRLTLLLPLFFVSIIIFKDKLVTDMFFDRKIHYFFFISSFVCLFSFINIDIPNYKPYYTILKTASLIYLCYVYCFLYVANLNKSQNMINK